MVFVSRHIRSKCMNAQMLKPNSIFRVVRCACVFVCLRFFFFTSLLHAADVHLGSYTFD